MPSAKNTKHLVLPQWDGNESMKRIDMNQAFKNIEEAVADFDYLSSMSGVKVVDNLAKVGKFDKWTSTITLDGIQLANAVQVESEANGKAVWNTTITFTDRTPNKVVSYTEKETDTGWERVIN